MLSIKGFVIFEDHGLFQDNCSFFETICYGKKTFARKTCDLKTGIIYKSFFTSFFPQITGFFIVESYPTCWL